LHTILLIAATTGVYFWLASPLSAYTLQLVALLVLLYLGSHWLKKHNSYFMIRDSVSLDITILTSMILLLISETGALTSPFFFLAYFLLFGVAMLYEIEATLVLTGVFILYFLALPGTNLSDLAHLSELIALIMITPLALFTGHAYETDLENRRTNAMLLKQLGTQETDTLMFLSLNLKSTLLKSLDTLSTIIPVTRMKDARSNLETLYSDLKVLYRTSADLEKAVDNQTDK